MKNLKFTIAILFILTVCKAQVGIGTNNPSSSSILHIEKLNTALRLPNMSSISTITSNPLDFEKGSLFFSLDNNENCVRYIKNDFVPSNCLITSEEVATAISFNQGNTNQIVSSFNYQDLVNSINITPQIYLRTFSINIDALREVSVSMVGACSNVNYRIVKHDNGTNIDTVLYETTSSITPRFANENDIFSYSKLIVGQIFPNEDVTFHFEYKNLNTCSNNLVNTIKSAEMQVVVY